MKKPTEKVRLGELDWSQTLSFQISPNYGGEIFTLNVVGVRREKVEFSKDTPLKDVATRIMRILERVSGKEPA